MKESEGPQPSVNSLLNDGARLLRSGRNAEALASLEQAYALAPDDPDVAITYGGALVMNAKWSRAVALLEMTAEKHPQNAQVWLNLAAAYLGRLEFSSRSAQDKAITAYERAIACDPVAPNAHYNVGLIHAERKEWDAAAAWFQAAVRANPADRDASWWLRKARTAQNSASDSA
ncbi:MAG: tetratricopeptide repeat protein [Caldilineales bacterium]|nr:tetratricopeptide repeat protein [Caldilineales bacterium]